MNVFLLFDSETMSTSFVLSLLAIVIHSVSTIDCILGCFGLRCCKQSTDRQIKQINAPSPKPTSRQPTIHRLNPLIIPPNTFDSGHSADAATTSSNASYLSFEDKFMHINNVFPLHSPLSDLKMAIPRQYQLNVNQLPSFVLSTSSQSDSSVASSRAFGAISGCADNPHHEAIQAMLRTASYSWTEEQFDQVLVRRNNSIQSSMLISIHLQRARMGYAQISDCVQLEILQSDARHSHIDTMVIKIKDVLDDIPSLFEAKLFVSINERVKEISNYVPILIEYLFTRTLSTTEKHTDHKRQIPETPDSLQLDETEDSKAEEQIYNAAFIKANYTETALDERFRTGKYQKLETLKTVTLSSELVCRVAMRHILNMGSSIEAILEIIKHSASSTRSDDALVLYHAVPVTHLLDELRGTARTVFADVTMTFSAQFYNYLAFNSLPTSFIRLLAVKFALHSRRNYWGRNAADNLKPHFSFRHIIRYDPFDIVLRFQMTDNGPPVQLKQLEQIRNRIKVYKDEEFFVESVNDDYENRHKWLNDLYFLSSWIAATIDGQFGIENLYQGTGEIRDIRSNTSTLYFECSILKGLHKNISIHDVEKIERMGMNEVMQNNIDHSFKDATADMLYWTKMISSFEMGEPSLFWPSVVDKKKDFV